MVMQHLKRISGKWLDKLSRAVSSLKFRKKTIGSADHLSTGKNSAGYTICTNTYERKAVYRNVSGADHPGEIEK